MELNKHDFQCVLVAAGVDEEALNSKDVMAAVTLLAGQYCMLDKELKADFLREMNTKVEKAIADLQQLSKKLNTISIDLEGQ